MGPVPIEDRAPYLTAIIAVEPEARAVIAEAAFGWKKAGEAVWDSGRFPLRLALSGVGKVLSSWCLARHAAGSGLVLSLGTSGGLGGEAVGSAWISAEFVEHDFDLSGLGYDPGVTPWEGMAGPVMRTAPPALVREARLAAEAAGIEVDQCRSASGDVFVSDAAKARNLAAHTGARLVDMESAALAKLVLLRAGSGKEAVRQGPSFLGFRYVSDNADHAARRSWEEETSHASRVFSAFLLAFVRSRSGA